MKKSLLIIVVLVVVFFFPKPFMSSPGFVSAETYQEFEATKKHCAGFSVLTNAEQMAADAPGKSLCFGWLYNKSSTDDVSVNTNLQNANGYDTQDYRQTTLEFFDIPQDNEKIVSYMNKAKSKKANFNGHYVIVNVGCGTNCAYPYIYDKDTGRIAILPQDILKNGLDSNLQEAVDLPEVESSADSNIISVKKYSADGQVYDNQWQLIENTFVEIQ